MNEQSAARANNNRLFDSQNNARGGYNVGDKTSQAFATNTAYLDPDQLYDPSDNTAAQYPMVFYEGSILPIQWTNQHGCGGADGSDPHTMNCNIVIQYACDTDVTQLDDKELTVELRDGVDTNSPSRPSAYSNLESTIASNRAAGRPRHESEASYLSCIKRPRNTNLFTADQNVKATAQNTRQNPNGGASGLECPEERDYYPYWRPTIWRDIAYLTSAYDDKSNIDICNFVLENSQNTKTFYKCSIDSDDTAAAVDQQTCESKGGKWEGFSHNIPPPACERAPWTRDNHLGDTRDANYANFTWTLPTFPVGADDPHNFKVLKKYGTNNDFVKCTLRLRYNITTDDYDPWNTDSSSNHVQGNSPATYKPSPVRNNPTVDIGADLQGLKLAINTAQYGRTFQDRSHVFYIKKRPPSFGNAKIYNLNVRGKRGNIVQVYPAVEYDFVPQTLRMKPTDLIHIQWTGSNRHNNGAPGGDGQTGDAGEGTGGTDRNNFVQTMGEGYNYPIALDNATETMWQYVKCYDLYGNWQNTQTNDYLTCPLILATSGQFRTKVAAESGTLDPLLNTAPASLVGGLVLKFENLPNQEREFTYMCTRNNNFSNRSQKGRIVISP